MIHQGDVLAVPNLDTATRIPYFHVGTVFVGRRSEDDPRAPQQPYDHFVISKYSTGATIEPLEKFIRPGTVLLGRFKPEYAIDLDLFERVRSKTYTAPYRAMTANCEHFTFELHGLAGQSPQVGYMMTVLQKHREAVRQSPPPSTARATARGVAGGMLLGAFGVVLAASLGAFKNNDDFKAAFVAATSGSGVAGGMIANVKHNEGEAQKRTVEELNCPTLEDCTPSIEQLLAVYANQAASTFDVLPGS